MRLEALQNVLAILLLAGLALACDARAIPADGGGGGGDGGGGDGGGGDGGGGDGATGDARPPGDGSSATTPLESCLKQQQTSFKLTCPAAGDFQYIVAGSIFRCLATQSFSKPTVRFLFKLQETVNGDPRIRRILVAKTQSPAPNDHWVAFEAPTPMPLSTLPSTLDWPVTFHPGGLAAGLTFIEGKIPQATLTIQTLDRTQLTGGTAIRASFTVQGGTFTYLDKQGNKQTAVDSTAGGKGCFNLQAELDAIL